MLEIRDVQYFADGRSVIDTVGGRRFKVLSRDTKDGYDTATVEFFQDECPSENEVEGRFLIYFLSKKYKWNINNQSTSLCILSQSLLRFISDLKKLHDQVFRTAGKWFNEMSESMKVRIKKLIEYHFNRK